MYKALSSGSWHPGSLKEAKGIRTSRSTFVGTPLAATRSRQRAVSSFKVRMTAEDKLAVLITGAAGGTGRLVFEKLLNHDFYEGNALVHTKESVKKLKDLEIPEGRISVADISKGPSPELDAAMKGIQALIICTSAMPKMVSPPKEGVPPQFAYEEGQYPEQVDWIGQKAQIDAAKKAGANQVVIVSSMGGTDKNNRLNSLPTATSWSTSARQRSTSSSRTSPRTPFCTPAASSTRRAERGSWCLA